MTALVAGTLGLCTAALIIWLIRRDSLHVDHGIAWLLTAAGFACLGFVPGIVDRVAAWVGIAYPPVLGLILAITLLVIKTLMMDIERSHLEVRNRRLAQRLAILEVELQALRKQSDETRDMLEHGQQNDSETL
jgi:hypothetical protein